MKFKLVYLIILLFCLSCKKEWQQPTEYTVNLSLYYTPDSVDNNLVYYYSNGMKLQIILNVNSAGETVKNEAWTNNKNYHWEDNLKSVILKGSVINLADTSFHIENYPVVMRVYEDGTVLSESVGEINNYKF